MKRAYLLVAANEHGVTVCREIPVDVALTEYIRSCPMSDPFRLGETLAEAKPGDVFILCNGKLGERRTLIVWSK